MTPVPEQSSVRGTAQTYAEQTQKRSGRKLAFLFFICFTKLSKNEQNGNRQDADRNLERGVLMKNRVRLEVEDNTQFQIDETVVVAHSRLKEKMGEQDEVAVGDGWLPLYELSVDDDGDILVQDNSRRRAFYVSAEGYIPETFPIPADGFQATDDELRELQCIETAADVVAVVDDILKHDMREL